MMRVRGFTLIELLVVISIIGLLSSVVLSSLNVARMKARDTLRATHIRALNTAVQAYMAETGRRPFGPGGNHLGSTVPCSTIGNAIDWSTGLAPLVSGGYIEALPTDPGGLCYTYSSFTNSGLSCGGESINNFQYVLAFGTEQPLSGYPVFHNATNRYCVTGPRVNQL